MIKQKYIRTAVLIAAALAASGCGVLKKGKAATPVLGQRIAVLTSEGDVTVDPATAALPMTLPEPVANADWAQPGGSASKSMGHLALGTALARAFTVQAGRGSSLTARQAQSDRAKGEGVRPARSRWSGALARQGVRRGAILLTPARAVFL